MTEERLVLWGDTFPPSKQNTSHWSLVVSKLKELEVKEKYQIEITNRFATLENLMFARM